MTDDERQAATAVAAERAAMDAKAALHAHVRGGPEAAFAVIAALPADRARLLALALVTFEAERIRASVTATFN